MSTPNAWQTMHAIAAWQSTRARLLDHDPDLANDETALIELLGPEDGEVQDILARALRAAVHAKTMATAAAEQGKRIAARKSRYESRKDDLYRLAFSIMDATGQRRMELPDLTASMRSGGQSVVITDETALPDPYVKITRTPDKALIAAALKTGTLIPGAELQNGIETLMIKES